MHKLLILPAMAVLISCGDIKDKQLSKKNSVEVVFETMHLNDSLDLLKIRRTVYIDNRTVKEFVSHDTIPSLGKSRIEDGSRRGKQLVEVPKEYEIYVTIK